VKRIYALSLVFLLISFFHRCLAHPAWGFVRTGTGEFVFSDVFRGNGTIWITTPDHKLIRWISDHNSHFIFQDEDGNIWITNHSYLSQTDKNENSLWRVTPKGMKNLIIPPTTDPRQFSGTNFVIDDFGNIIYDYQNSVLVRTPEHVISEFSTMKFERIMAMQRSNQFIYIVDNSLDSGSIFALDRYGNATQVATGLLESAPPDPPFDEQRFNLLFGVFVDEFENLYIANSGSRRVSMIDGKGSVSHIYFSESPWYPVSVIAEQDKLFVLEGGDTDTGNIGPRVIQWRENRRLEIANTENYSGEERTRTKKAFSLSSINPWILLIVGLLLLGILLSLVRIILGK